MQVSHEPERTMAWHPINIKHKMPADVIEKCRIGWTTDRWQVQFHLYPAHTFEVSRIDQPFCSLAVAFQKVTASCHCTDFVERERGCNDRAVVPPDFPGIPISQCRPDNLHRNRIQPDIFPEDIGCYRFNCDNAI